MKYMGIMVTSHSMKNKNRSNAANTTIMAPSTNRIMAMNDRTLTVMDFHEHKTAKGQSRVVSMTSKRLIPSTPTAY